MEAKYKLIGEPFFYYFSWALLATVLLAFGLNIAFAGYALYSPMPVIVAHGIAMLAWYSLLVRQTGLIRSRAVKTHMRQGMMSIALAVIVVLSGATIAIMSFRVHGEAIGILGNFLAMLTFSILYFCAIKYRRIPLTHKRLMLLAGVAMLAPALVRIVRLLGLDQFFTLPFWLVFMAVLPVYDWKKNGRISRTTYLGTGLIILGVVVNIGIGTQNFWERFVRSIL
jgi:hypothetical protein